MQFSNSPQSFEQVQKTNNQTFEVNSLIKMVPKHFRKHIKYGVFIVPNNELIENYFERKQSFLQIIQNTKQPSVNSMHKYTSANPLKESDIQKINQKVSQSLGAYYQANLKKFAFKNETKFFAGFAITYNQGHKALSLHTDDSIYTINFCFKSSANGNQVVFYETFGIQPIEDYALIHSGKIPHHTNNLIQGERTNLVLWFK